MFCCGVVSAAVSFSRAGSVETNLTVRIGRPQFIFVSEGHAFNFLAHLVERYEPACELQVNCKARRQLR